MKRDIVTPHRGASRPSRSPTAVTDVTKRDMSQESRVEAAALVNTARQHLGAAYGLGRPLRRVELARLVGLGAAHVELLAKGKAALSGPVEVVIRMLLAGHRSPHHEEALRARPRALTDDAGDKGCTDHKHQCRN